MVSDGKIYIQEFSRKGTAANPCSVRFDNTNCLSYQLRRYPKASANSTNRCRGRSDEGICAIVNVQHESISAFDKHAFVCGDRRMKIRDTVDNVGPQLVRKILKQDEMKNQEKCMRHRDKRC